MVTIYDLLEVNENASKEEIEKAYQNLIIEYQTNPVLTPEENRQNELILNKLKMGYEILTNDEKRARYDKELAKKRAEELIKQVPENNSEDDDYKEPENNKYEEPEENEDYNTQSVANSETAESSYYDIPKVKNTRYKEDGEDDVQLTKEEQKKIKKAAQKEFNENLKKVQKAEEEYTKAYNDAYNDYLKKMGYKTSEKWTLKRIKSAIIVILAIVLVCVVAWIIPPIRAILIDVYEKNFIIKSLVDIVKFMVQAVVGIFK